MIFILCLVLTLVSYSLITWIIFMNRKRKVKLPGPTPWPILGSGHRFICSPSQFIKVLHEFAEDYGPGCYVHVASDGYAVLSHPKYIEIFSILWRGYWENAVKTWLYQFSLKFTSYCLNPAALSEDKRRPRSDIAFCIGDQITLSHADIFLRKRCSVSLADSSRDEIIRLCKNFPVISNMEFITKDISYSFMEPWLGQGLLTASGNRWKTHRKFLTPAFHFNILQNFLPVFCKNGTVLVKKLKKLADGKTAFDLFPIIALAALDNVTESIMGVCVDAQQDCESPYVKAIEDLSNLISTRMRNPLIRVNAIFNLLPHKRRQDKALTILHGQTRKVIETRREELKKLNITDLKYNAEFGIKNKHAFLDLLLLADIDGKKINDEKIREEVDTFMFEGHDTTTSGIVFALYCISNHEDVQRKILEEQRSIFANDFYRDPTYSEISQMKYLELVIKESLRLYPSVPFIGRKVLKDADVAGLHLLRDVNIVINIFHMQRRADVYEEPLEFRPERFNEGKDSKNAFNWLSFSAGPRNCIGQKFAMMELKVTLSAIVRNFKIIPSHIEPILCADLILRSQNGVHVKLAPRS